MGQLPVKRVAEPFYGERPQIEVVRKPPLVVVLFVVDPRAVERVRVLEAKDFEVRNAD